MSLQVYLRSNAKTNKRQAIQCSYCIFLQKKKISLRLSVNNFRRCGRIFIHNYLEFKKIYTTKCQNHNYSLSRSICSTLYSSLKTLSINGRKFIFKKKQKKTTLNARRKLYFIPASSAFPNSTGITSSHYTRSIFVPAKKYRPGKLHKAARSGSHFPG